MIEELEKYKGSWERKKTTEAKKGKKKITRRSIR
jgi:hypothetical protein